MPPIGSCLWAGNIIDFLKHLSSYLFTKFSSHVMRTFSTYSLSNFHIYNRVLLTVVTILYITITNFFKWDFSIWFSGTFLKLLIFILLSDFGILVFFSVNSQKHYSQEQICSVKLGQYLRSHRVEFSLRESKLIQSEGQQRKILDITSLVLISLLVTARPSSYGSACPSLCSSNAVQQRRYSGTHMNFSGITKHSANCLAGALHDWVDIHKLFNVSSFQILNMPFFLKNTHTQKLPIIYQTVLEGTIPSIGDTDD